MEMLSFETDLESVIRPPAKLHVAVLVVEGEPGDVDLAGGLEDAWRDLLAVAGAVHDNVGGEGGVKVLVSAVVEKNVWLPHRDGRNSQVLDIPVFRRVPHQALVHPLQVHPDIAGQDLIFLIQIHDLF